MVFVGCPGFAEAPDIYLVLFIIIFSLKKTTERTENSEKRGNGLCPLRTLWLIILIHVNDGCTGFREAPDIYIVSSINIDIICGKALSFKFIF